MENIDASFDQVKKKILSKIIFINSINLSSDIFPQSIVLKSLTMFCCFQVSCDWLRMLSQCLTSGDICIHLSLISRIDFHTLS